MFFKTLAAGVASISLFCATANAADFLTPQEAGVQTYGGGSYDWTGPYLGVIAGGHRMRAKDDFVGSTNYEGALFGAHAGYNFTFGKALLGVEVEGDGSTIDETSSLGNEVEVDYFATAKLRAGFTHDRFAFYGTAGLVAAKATIESPTRGVSDSNVHYGYTLGAGVEAFVTKNVSARLEYQHSFLRDKTYNIGASDFDVEGDVDAIYFGLSYHF